MQLCRSISEFQNTARNAAFAAGFFDGVHLGHQRVIASALATGHEAWALTFAQHPSKLLAPQNPRKLLTPLETRLELLAATGLTGCLLLDFSRQLASMPPREFIAGLGNVVRSFHCGENWRFGFRGEGTPTMLREMGFYVEVVPAALWRGEPVSSTRIREAVQSGALEDAAQMLGRPHSVRGTVARGRAVGRAMGVPTLNVVASADVPPPHGVYAARVRFKNEIAWRDAVANFGFRPTFADRPDEAVLEAHLFEAPECETYGLDVEVAFVARLREERAFESPAALAEQIKIDRERAVKIFTP